MDPGDQFRVATPDYFVSVEGAEGDAAMTNGRHPFPQSSGASLKTQCRASLGGLICEPSAIPGSLQMISASCSPSANQCARTEIVPCLGLPYLSPAPPPPRCKICISCKCMPQFACYANGHFCKAPTALLAPCLVL